MLPEESNKAGEIGLEGFGEKEAEGRLHCLLQFPVREEMEREVLTSSPWYSVIGHVGMVYSHACGSSDWTLGIIL